MTRSSSYKTIRILLHQGLGALCSSQLKEWLAKQDGLAPAEYSSIEELEALIAPGTPAVVVSLEKKNRGNPSVSTSVPVHWVSLHQNDSEQDLLFALSREIHQINCAREHEEMHARVVSLEHHLRELNAIGASLSTEKDLDELLKKILHKAREIASADSGSLCLVESEDGDEAGKEASRWLRFKLAQNDSMEVEFSEFTLPINSQSIVGHVAFKGNTLLIDDVYDLSNEEFQHNRDFDCKTGYRTKSMLVTPMHNQHDEMVGVLQLINKKKEWGVPLDKKEKFETEVLPFSNTDRELVESLASQASVAIENARLYNDIQNLFEGFIRASVLAIESRDPTTSGHSARVAEMTCALAKLVDEQDSGPFQEIRFDEQDMQELHYASLLHDFGKIGVREEVLVKAKKLYPHELEVIRSRFEVIRHSLQLEYTQMKTEVLIEKGRENAQQRLQEIDRELANQLAEIDRYLDVVMKSAEPTVLEDGDFNLLSKIAEHRFMGLDEKEHPFLTKEEVEFLSIRKGSLSVEERLAIESHVLHSYNFLKTIPWTKQLRGIPGIVLAHHEKINGEGYPRGITLEQIPFQTRIMMIADIFDALSARDRPYKKAVPVKRALEILKMEVDEGKLDPDLYRLFLDGEVYKLVIDD